MISLNSRFAINTAEVAAKVLDGEAILINLSTGTYYGIDKAGCRIWEMIEKGYNQREIIETVVALYDVPAERAKADIESLISELIKENLIMVADNSPSVAKYQMSLSEQKLPYDQPKLNIYRDMADLLALDPPMPKLDNAPWRDSQTPS